MPTQPRSPRSSRAVQIHEDTRESLRTLKRRLGNELDRDVTFTEIVDALLATADDHRDEFVAHLIAPAKPEPTGETS